MDFFDDPNLFVGGLEGLDDDGFPPGPSIVDELNLTADFEPIHLDPMGREKSHEQVPPLTSASSHQVMLAYTQQMGHYMGIKTQNAAGYTFPAPVDSGGGAGGMMSEQHSQQYHNATMSQMPQTNGLFCNGSSPMWGNQDQNTNMYHPLTQQQQPICHQQLHNQQLHVRHQTQPHLHQPCHNPPQQHPMRQQLQHQQLLNHGHHQHQSMSTSNTQHQNFTFHQECPPQNQQQIHHSQRQHNIAVGGPRLLTKAMPHKAFLENKNAPLNVTCLQQQNNYQLMTPQSGDSNMPFSVHSSSMVHSMPTCSVSSATAYPSAQYPAYPGQPEMPSLTASHSSTMPDSSGPVCRFSSTTTMNQHNIRIPVSQAEECHFKAGCGSGNLQGSCKTEMFGESTRCYPNMVNHSSFGQQQSCQAIATNGYQALRGNLQQTEAQDGVLESLDPPDLLPDILPQLEAALSQQEESNCSWTDSIQERGHETKAPPVECNEEKVK